MKRYFAIVLVFILGCASSRTQTPSDIHAVRFDRCAEHLQEICGIILEYYVDNRQLPANIEQLQALAAQQNEPGDLFVCPVSHLRYIYNPDGVPLYGMNPPARLVMYDAQPVHDGYRRGIAITPATPGRPLVCRVISVPGRMVLSAPTTQPAGSY